MKRVILLTLFVFLGCGRELTREEGERVYSHEIDLSKQEMKIQILSFINENYISGKSIIQTNEDGLIAGNVTGAVVSSGLTINTTIEYSFIIKYEDKSYRLKCVVKGFQIVGSRTFYHVPSNRGGKYAEEIKQIFDSFDSSLYEYLNKKGNF